MSEMFPQSHMNKILQVDTNHLRDLLDFLEEHHRVARSLDFLGTILKVVVRTPDPNDLEKIKFKDQQLDNSNK